MVESLPNQRTTTNPVLLVCEMYSTSTDTARLCVRPSRCCCFLHCPPSCLAPSSQSRRHSSESLVAVSKFSRSLWATAMDLCVILHTWSPTVSSTFPTFPTASSTSLCFLQNGTHCLRLMSWIFLAVSTRSFASCVRKPVPYSSPSPAFPRLHPSSRVRSCRVRIFPRHAAVTHDLISPCFELGVPFCSFKLPMGARTRCVTACSCSLSTIPSPISRWLSLSSARGLCSARNKTSCATCNEPCSGPRTAYLGEVLCCVLHEMRSVLSCKEEARDHVITRPQVLKTRSCS